MESYEILWKTTLPELEKTVSSISYDTYISQLTPVDVVGGKIILCTQSKLFADTVSAKMREKICEALKKSNADISDFSVVVANDREDYLNKFGNEAAAQAETQGAPVNPRFTFDSFVVGPSNEFIFAAAKAVAEKVRSLI